MRQKKGKKKGTATTPKRKKNHGEVHIVLLSKGRLEMDTKDAEGQC
jgi:hypothetical protein